MRAISEPFRTVAPDLDPDPGDDSVYPAAQRAVGQVLPELVDLELQRRRLQLDRFELTGKGRAQPGLLALQLFQLQRDPFPVQLDFVEGVLRYPTELHHRAGLPCLDRQGVRRQPRHAQLYLQIVHLLLVLGPGPDPAIGEQVDFTLPLLQIPPQSD